MADITGLRWCSKCQVLLRDAKPAACSAGDHHDASTSGRYFLAAGPAPDERHEGGWRSCPLCRAVYRPADPISAAPEVMTSATVATGTSAPVNPSPDVAMPSARARGWQCPAVGADGAHGDDGAELAVRVETEGAEQPGWRRCSKCWSLFYGGGGDTNGVCPFDSQHHSADGRHMVVEFERLATLPWPNAIGAGKQVELKYEAPGDIWSGAGAGRWITCSPTEWLAESDWGASAWRVHLRLDHGPTCWVEFGLSVHTSLLGLGDSFLSKGFSSPPAVPCYNDSGFDPTDGQVEWDGGKNNNGVELTLQAGVAVIRIWPKREDRIRFDFQQFAPFTPSEEGAYKTFRKDHPTGVWREFHFELDTSE